MVEKRKVKPPPVRDQGIRMDTKSKMAQLINGELSVMDMDDEELARGYFKDKNGRFTGRPPVVVSKELHQEMSRRLLERGNEMFAESFAVAIETIAAVAKDPEAKQADRLKAAGMIIDRVAGKVTEKVELSQGDAPWKIAINDIIVGEVHADQGE